MTGISSDREHSRSRRALLAQLGLLVGLPVFLQPGLVGGQEPGPSLGPPHGKGVNVDPHNPAAHSPEPRTLRQFGITAVRLVSRRDNGVEAYARSCRESGIFVLAVVTSTSEGHLLANADAYQIGNEPDGVGRASMIQTEDEYVDMWSIYRGTYPDKLMIAAGLTRSNPNWLWERVAPRLEGCGGVGVHMYLHRTTDETHELLDRYNSISPELPIWVTEWHPPQSDISELMPDIMRILRRDTVRDFFYCWSDGQTPERGLFKEDGTTPKAEWWAFTQTA
jgi:Glycosyl hydrolase catalytic core